jgi:hypothetical protein
MPWLIASDKEIPIYKVGEKVDIKAIRIIEGKVSIAKYKVSRPKPQVS